MIQLTKVQSTKAVEVIARKAFAAGEDATKIGSVGGCGRVYIDLGPMRSNSRIIPALKAVGFKVTSRPFYSGKFIYVGYDNATGYEWNKAELIAQSFRDQGIEASVSGDGD